MSTLLELADRLEQAEGPSQELDCRIMCAIEGRSFDVCQSAVPDLGQWITPGYTYSLDAAIGLVPEAGHSWAGGTCGEDDGPWACVTSHTIPCPDYASGGSTAALALCAAALRARASVLVISVEEG